MEKIKLEKVNLNIDIVQKIMDYLTARPWREVAGIINEVSTQIQMQLKDKETSEQQ